METNGVTHAYVPPRELTIAPQLRLHTATADVDPITYEVLRHSLWNVNDEHGAHIIKVSGSPIALYGQDFNPTICMEDGEILYSGPFIQFMSGTADLMVKWTLERRSANPGIRDGDMYVSCDPWIGAPHQPDNYLMCPIFWEGELFGWAVNTLHLHEVGGVTPGSFCPDAANVFSEATPIPPVKLVSGGELQADVEEMIIRRSRMPSLVALDLRSQIAGANFARERILTLIRRYGADVVKGVMKRITGAAQASLAAKLREIPDGTYRDVQYTGVALPGDREIYRIELTATKEGDRISFANAGTDPAAGTLGCVFCGWRSAIVAATNAILGWDQLYATGGVIRCLDFEPAHGTMTCADHPSAVTMYSSVLITSAMAARVLSKMVASVPELAGDALGPSGFSNSLYTGFGGRDADGHPFGTVTLDQMAGGLAAFADRDGISTGGTWWAPQSSMANCEEVERNYPLLHLYRREVHGGGGHGRWRGGDGIVVAWVPYEGSELEFATTTAATVVPNTIGLSGGYPGAIGGHFRVADSDVWERMQRREPIADPDALRALGDCERVPPKLAGVPLGSSDLLEMRCPSPGGFGDPLLREPERVAQDVRDGRIEPAAALTYYGVVLDDLGDATARERTRRFSERLGGARPAAVVGDERLDGAQLAAAGESRLGDVPPTGEQPQVRVHEHVGVFEDGAYRCLRCTTQLGTLEDGYRCGLRVLDRPLPELGAHYVDPVAEVDAPLVARMLCCPGCGVLTDVEVARADDPVYDDVRVAADVLAVAWTVR
ncbi:hydantoinase B/oxoprolinase family protein [Conexibacter sp. CPCC 206217]|uniref:hydantoinase B/oxoprolinase family protein n=1 Tax=Conexibacter sp. CPCC 206217 TaxID=3064574 RepID=UPI002724F72A|nr:hydantoinase B/oxoprolinase family protein [Conexibacter sp. CPCC 206217]MDO8211095.1 hydantoinase B/oxoprolinase family protein [Conexibacter sp. CPCC 206217]